MNDWENKPGEDATGFFEAEKQIPDRDESRIDQAQECAKPATEDDMDIQKDESENVSESVSGNLPENVPQNAPLIDEAIFGAGILESKVNTAQAWNDAKEMVGAEAENMYPYQDRKTAKEERLYKTSNKPMIIALALLFLLLLGLIAYVVVSLSKGFSHLQSKKDTTYETDADDPWAEILGEEQTDQQGIDSDYDTEAGQSMDDFFDGDISEDDSWKDEFVNHDRSEFTGPYYEDFVDSIDENVSYVVRREFEEIEDKKNNIMIRISYVQLDGDIPNSKEINSVLKEAALEKLTDYQQNKREYDQMVQAYGMGIKVSAKSFVTYNDEETISVAIMKESDVCGSQDLGITSVNVSLATGTVLDNTQILKLEDSFGEEFRQRSNKQNGTSYGIDLFSNMDIVNMLHDRDSLILFYTPIGMELGYSYQYGGYYGWITISMEDYKEYINGL